MRAAPELSPPKSACAGDTVLRTSTRGTVNMGQYSGCHRGHHLAVNISTMTYTVTGENPHADGSASPGAWPRFRPPAAATPKLRHVPRTHFNRMAGRQMSCRQQTAPPQSRCSKDVTAHPIRPGARPGRPCPVPDCRAATARPEKIQLPIAEQNFHYPHANCYPRSCTSPDFPRAGCLQARLQHLGSQNCLL
jgi:hypothetical protein